MARHCASLLLLLALLGVIFTSDSFVTKGTFAVTGPEYKGRSTRFYSNNGEFIDKIFIDEGYDLLRFCNLRCNEIEDCKSFRIYEDAKKCTLLRMDPCSEPRRPITAIEESAVQYDVRDGVQVGAASTCFRKCMSAMGSCKECGRGDNCSGDMCSDCIEYCWQFEPLKRKTSYRFIVDPFEAKDFVCHFQWQRVWAPGVQQWEDYPDRRVSKLFLKLRVTIMYVSKRYIHLYFDDFRANEDLTFSLGGIRPESQFQSNFWNAPFQNRGLVTPEDPNCLPFFYAEDPCPSKESDSRRRFVFPVGNASYDGQQIISILFFITPMN